VTARLEAEVGAFKSSFWRESHNVGDITNLMAQAAYNVLANDARSPYKSRSVLQTTVRPCWTDYYSDRS